MIYDLGCLGKPNLWASIWPAGWQSLPAIGAVLTVFMGCALIGHATSPAAGFRGERTCASFGFAAAFMTLGGTLFPQALLVAASILLAAALLAARPALRRGIFKNPLWLLVAFPGLLVLAQINNAGVAKWDDFATWGPNALYLFQNNSFPHHSLPPPHSVMPGYPYALPLVTYLASLVADGYVVQAAAMFNFLGLLLFASFLAGLLPATAAGRADRLMVLLLAALATTFLNPGFNASFSVTSQADTLTAVFTAVIAILYWRRSNDEESGIPTPEFFSIIGCTLGLVLLKQSNLVLLILLAAGALVVSLRTRDVRAALPVLAAGVVPALALHFIWARYVDTEIAGNGFAFKPIASWRWDLVRPLLNAMGEEALKKSGLTLLILGIGIYAIATFFKKPTPLRRLAWALAVTSLGYIAFLTCAYLGSDFVDIEIRRASSFYRYQTHLSLMAVAFIWLALGAKAPSATVGWVPVIPARKSVVIAVVMLIFPGVLVIHSEWLVPKPDAQICAMRETAHSLATSLPDHTRLVIFEPETDGLLTYVANYEFQLEASRTGKDLIIPWYIEKSHYHFDAKDIPLYEARVEADPTISAVLAPRALLTPVQLWGEENDAAPLLLERDQSGWKRVSF